MSKFYFDKVYNNLDQIYFGFPQELIDNVKKLIDDINEINDIFKNEIKNDLHRKRLIINISSSYLENFIDIILKNKYLADNNLAERLLDKVRKTGMSGFNILIINNLMQIFDDGVAGMIESTFNKKGPGKKLKNNNLRFNQFRNECSHIGDLSKTEVSGTGIEIIYGYILEGLIIIYIIYYLINGIKFKKYLNDIFDKFGYGLL